MSGDWPEKKKPTLRYSDSPYAPEWAKDPALRNPPRQNVITSFGKPIPEGPEPEALKASYPSSHIPPPTVSAHKPLPGKPAHNDDEPYRPSVERIENILWDGTDNDLNVYGIMDGYWAKGLYGRLLASKDISWGHMFHSSVAMQRIQDAPFIIALKRGHPLTKWLIEEGWGEGWGIYVTASTKKLRNRYGKPRVRDKHFLPTNEELVRLGHLVEGEYDPLWVLRRHFRRFAMVEFEDDARVVHFRYYDPATIRTYVPSCNNSELFTIFGPVKHMFAEGYCEVESLNRREEFTRFEAQFDGLAPFNQHDPAILYQGICLNLIERKQRSIPRSPASEKYPDRNTGFVPMIRKGQKREFEIFQTEILSQKLLAGLLERLLSQGIMKYNIIKMKDAIAFTFRDAPKIGLKTEWEYFSFAYCVYVLDPHFYQQPVFHELIEKNRQGDISNIGNLFLDQCR